MLCMFFSPIHLPFLNRFQIIVSVPLATDWFQTGQVQTTLPSNSHFRSIFIQIPLKYFPSSCAPPLTLAVHQSWAPKNTVSPTGGQANLAHSNFNKEAAQNIYDCNLASATRTSPFFFFLCFFFCSPSNLCCLHYAFTVSWGSDQEHRWW